MLLCSVLQVSALDAFPLNTQFPDVYNGGYWFLGYDSLHSSRYNALAIPEFGLRYGFKDRYRLGFLSTLVYANETSFSGQENSGFGFGNLDLSFEYELIDEHLTWFFNQYLPVAHSDLVGTVDYGLATGFEMQKPIYKKIALWTELGYQADFINSGVDNLFTYNNALTYDIDKVFNPFIELLGVSDYQNDITTLQLVPGWSTNVNQYYFLVGIPIGLNEDSPDYGIQIYLAGVF